MGAIRKLRADEIECRIGQIKKDGSGLSLLLYKDARCDMNILDETFGTMNWKRRHTRDNANCIVSVWDADKKEWIEKEDTGTESNTEAAKGLASDSFKRACVNIGIGRELYTSPFIWISNDKCEIKKSDRGTWYCSASFTVTEIGYDDAGTINRLRIRNDKTGIMVYEMGVAKHSEKPAEETKYRCTKCDKVLRTYIGADGKEVSLRKHAEGSKKKFGDVYCIDCIRSMNNDGDRS